MLENQNIIIFALPRYDGKYESTSFNMACELAKRNRVFYVDNPFTFMDVVRHVRSGQIKKRLKYFLPFSKDLLDFRTSAVKLKILITPPVLPINMLPPGKLYNLLSRLNHRIAVSRINRLLKIFAPAPFIYINSFNFYYPDMGDFLSRKPKLSLYHCVDAMIREFTLRHGPYLEERLLRKVNLVISTSKALTKEKGAINPNSYFVANAANFEHSSKALNGRIEIPAQMEMVNKPVIGYFGNIERRIDYELLRDVMQRHDDWTLALVGPVEAGYFPEWFGKLPNVILPGKQPYAQMPAFLKAFDVTVIPFKIDSVSRTIFPLKLFEYLGAGKPIITTNFNPDVLNELRDVVYLGYDADTFEQSIEKALAENNEDKVKQRLKVAQQNTWEARGIEFSSILEQWLKDGTGSKN